MGAGRKIEGFISLILMICLSVFKVSSQDIRIGLFDDQFTKTIVFHCTNGVYQVLNNDQLIREIKKGEIVYISVMDDSLALMDGDLHYGIYNDLRINQSANNSTFNLKTVDPAGSSRSYSGNLELNRFHGSIQMINQLPFDDYLAGVVETEVGSTATIELYKAQAILCRTYAIKNWDRHPGQNFNLCDNTHCQAFHGLSMDNPIITEAVLGTNSLVLTDSKGMLVSAIFHSNSGGETQRASDVWNSGEDYLQAVVDPFSLGLRSAKWENSIPKADWIQYLSGKISSDIKKLTDDQILIKQEHRRKLFIVGKDSLRISDIRTDLKLRSSFFTMELANDTILIHGKGYGHGVGLSQEGAIEMAKQGYSASDILGFYFYNVQVVELDEVPDYILPAGIKKQF